jgi:hypothetical protein
MTKLYEVEAVAICHVVIRVEAESQDEAIKRVKADEGEVMDIKFERFDTRRTMTAAFVDDVVAPEDQMDVQEIWESVASVT